MLSRGVSNMEETIQHTTSDSIEVSRNAKGDVARKCKIYFDNGTQGYMDTVDELVAIDKMLREQFL